MSPVILKLGGSVITDKDRPETVDEGALELAASAIATAREADGGLEELVIVHGGGSFGHVHATEHGVSTIDGTHDPAAIRAIHGAMKSLDDAVLRALEAHDVPVVPVHPLSTAHRDADGELHLPVGQVRVMLEEGLIPVLHGDLVAHAGRGTTVLSGDELVADLARSLDADRIGLCSTVPGVLDDGGAVVDRIVSFDDVASILGASESTDVTGGMAAKVRALLALEAEASIFGLEALAAFLEGEEPGTTVA